MLLRNFAKAVPLALALIAPAAAHAASRAMVTTDLNMRTGPGAYHHRIDVIPGGARVSVYGCRSNDWCRVNWAGRSGWVSSHYLTFGRAGHRVRRHPRVIVRPPSYSFWFGLGSTRWDHRHGHRHHRRDHDGHHRRRHHRHHRR